MAGESSSLRVTGSHIAGNEATFNLANGTISQVLGNASAIITPQGDGWYRCSVYFPGPDSFLAVFTVQGSTGQEMYWGAHNLKPGPRPLHERGRGRSDFDHSNHSLAIDVVGTVYEPTGEMLDGPMGPQPVMAAIRGWHNNARVVDDAYPVPTEALALYLHHSRPHASTLGLKPAPSPTPLPS